MINHPIASTAQRTILGVALLGVVLLSVPQVRAEAVDAPHQVLTANFDEATDGRLIDTSPLNNEISMRSGAAIDKGWRKGGVVFDGVGANLSVSNTPELAKALSTGILFVSCYAQTENDEDGGIFLKREGSFILGLVPWDTTRVRFSIWNRRKGFVSLESEAGAFTPGKWHHVAGICDGKEMVIYVDGKKVAGLETSATANIEATGPLSVGTGLMPDGSPTQEPFRGKLDQIEIATAIPAKDYFQNILAERTEDFSSTLVKISRPPLQKPAKVITEKVPPSIVKASDALYKIDNAYFSLSLSLEKGLTVQRIFNKYIDGDCLTPDRNSPVFYLSVGGKRFTSRDFQVDNVLLGTGSENAKEKTLTINLSLPDENISAVVKVAADTGSESIWSLKFENKSTNEMSVRGGFPFFENIQVGTDLADNYYFWPMISGWVGHKSFLLGMEYGRRCSLPLMDVSSPLTGGGLYFWPRDPTGAIKRILLQKTRKNGTVGTNYNIVIDKPIDPFKDTLGTSIGVFFDAQTIAPSSDYTMHDAVLGVHGGTALKAIKSYSDWAHASWYKHDPLPDSLKRDFEFSAVQRNTGNTGFNKGMLHDGRLVLSEQIDQRRGDHHIQVNGWWAQPGKDPFPNNGGDYFYDPAAPPARLAEEIAKCHKLGTRVSLYLSARSVGPSTEIVKAHGKEWGFMDEPNHYAEDWGVFSICPHVYPWQDYLAEVHTRLMKDLKPDGLYLDVAPEVMRCFNPLHPHAPDKVSDITRLLTKIRDAIKSVDPKAFFQVEFLGSDYWSQYIDATWSQTFAHPFAKDFNEYDLIYFRYAFPEVKLIEWGQTADTFEVDSRRALFNGIGLCRGDLTEDQTYRLATISDILRENGDAFSDLSPEPFVETGTDHVYANKFPTKNKIAYTVYNKNDAAITGPVVAVQPKPNFHYIDASNNLELEVTERNGKQFVNSTLKSNEVVCILELPKLLTLTPSSSSVQASVISTGPAILTAHTQKEGVRIEIPCEANAAGWEIPITSEMRGFQLVIKAFQNDFVIDIAILAL